MFNRILGVDPGLSGAAAIYCPAASLQSGLRWHLFDVATVGEGTQRRINGPAFRDWISRFDPEVCYFENVSVMPKQGIASSGRFMRAVGSQESIIACLNVPIRYIVPQRWKKFYGLKGSDKERSRATALQRFPELGPMLTRKLDHGRAEAALLAAYGFEMTKE